MAFKRWWVSGVVVFLVACGDDDVKPSPNGGAATSDPGSGDAGGQRMQGSTDADARTGTGGSPVADSGDQGGAGTRSVDCRPVTYPEGGPCYECAARNCCLLLFGCATGGKGWVDGGVFYSIRDECYDGPVACARTCFEREIGAAMSKASADVAHDCAIACGADIEPSTDPNTQQPSNYPREAFISLVDCLAALTDASEPDEDGGAAAESCAQSCFEGWR